MITVNVANEHTKVMLLEGEVIEVEVTHLRQITQADCNRKTSGGSGCIENIRSILAKWVSVYKNLGQIFFLRLKVS